MGYKQEGYSHILSTHFLTNQVKMQVFSINELILESHDFKWNYKTFDCGENIFTEENILWLIHRGVVKTHTWNEEGKPIILGYWVAGDVVGQPISIIEPYEIKCLTDVKAAPVSSQYWHYLATEIRNNHMKTEELLYIFRQKSLYEKTIKLLVFLAKKLGVEHEKGKLISIPLTHQELADFTGGTRVSITKIINQLERKKLIERPNRSHLILSPTLLK